MIYKRIALLFPGQGSQLVGMGKDLIKDFPYISKIYEHSDKVLNFPISNLMFNGPAEELKQTDNTQPALLLHSFSMIKILEKELGYSNNNDNSDEYKVSSEFIKRFDFALGHSLGEYSALATSNSISYTTALELVRYRGSLMKQPQPGVMYALLSKSNMIESGSLIEIKNIINQVVTSNDITTTTDKMVCNISNINSPNQIVISGNESGVLKVIQLCKTKKLFNKSVKLPVGAAFHSDLMKDSTDKFKLKLDTINFKIPEIKVISNVNSLPYNNIDKSSNESIPSLLSKQLSSTVEWKSSIDYCVNQWKKDNLQANDYCFIELGSNNVLTELLKQIYPNSTSKSIQTSNDLIEFIKDFKN